MLADVRYAVRSFLKTPGFTSVAILALALGIGANTAIFSVVNGVLLKQLPYRDPDRLAVVWERNLPRDRATNVVGPANFLVWRDESRAFESMGAVSFPFGVNLTAAGDPVEVRAQLATAEVFPILGVNAEIGRTFTRQEDDANADVVVISHRLWQTRLRGAPITGRAITLNGRAQTVVGVMPAGFQFLDRTIDVWYPVGFTAASRVPRGRSMSVVGRLAPGISIDQAQAEMDGIAARLTARFPDFDTGWTINIVPIAAQITGDVRPSLYVLLGAVGFVLLIACANVANLLLARATARQREIAVRSALGADRWRIARQLLTESVLLGLAGGAAGLALAWAGVRTLTSAADQVAFPRADVIGLDLRVLIFTAVIAVVSGAVFGLAPALTSSSPDLTGSLKDGGRGGTSGGGGARNTFVVIEIALALVLLVGAGLLVRSFVRVMGTSPGFDADHALTAQLTLPTAKYGSMEVRAAFFRGLLDRVGALPGVTHAGGVSFLPITGLAAATRFEITGQPKPQAGQEPVSEVRIVAGDYFGAMQIPLVSGRTFNAREEHEPSPYIVINDTLARRYFPNQNPIGQHLTVSWNGTGPDEIIGVVGDIKMTTLEEETRPAVYYPYARTPYPTLTIVVRTPGDPLGAAPALLQQLREMDADIPAARLLSMTQVVGRSVAQRRIVMLLIGVFAAIAVALAGVGIYGVMAYMVSRRTREIGIRMALGATRAAMLRMVLGQAMALTAAGVVCGALGALALTRLMATLLFGIEPSDPATFIVVSLLLTAIAAAAALAPGIRATRVDPGMALRAD